MKILERPYAIFSFNREAIGMNKEEFEKACLSGSNCGCGNCLSCASLKYKKATESIKNNPYFKKVNKDNI